MVTTCDSSGLIIFSVATYIWMVGSYFQKLLNLYLMC